MATDRYISPPAGSALGGQGAALTGHAPAASESRSHYEDPGYGINDALDAFTGETTDVQPVDPTDLFGHDVTAILVAHNGSRWLPRTLEALGALTHVPGRIFAVDTGSRDETPELLTNALGATAVVTAPRNTGFGAAVARGVQAADEMIASSRRFGGAEAGRTEWIWLLHDDSAPAPDALRRLLETAVRRPDAGVIGPKVLGWRGDRQLLEVGLTISGGGRRHTGLDRREYDQGQHDISRDVLAVGSAGMLIRRDVWDELNGFDPLLSVFRDDIDFGWRANQAGHAVVLSPESVVYHAEAAAHGRRRLGATRHRAHLADRRNALYVLLVNSPALWLPLLFIRILAGGIGRSFGFLFGKQPALAVEELGAVLAVLGRPDRVIRGRARRAQTRRRSHGQLRPLFPPRGQQLRHAGENVLAMLTGSGSGHDVPGSQRRAATGDTDETPETDDTFVLRLLLHPLVLAVTSLVLITLLAIRDVIGGGRLIGGALLPVVSDVSGLWQSYTESWHGVGLGSPTASPPYLAVVAALGWVVRDSGLAVDLLMLGSVPLAGITAYLLLRRLVAGRWLRLWGSVAYALLPATTGALAAGRIGTVVAAVLTPLLVLALYRTLGRPGEPGPFRAAWSAGLILAVIAAFVPLAWIIVILLSVVALATVFRDRASLLRLAVTMAVAPVVLIPWSGSVLSTPMLLVTEAGMPGPGLSDDALEPWSILLQQPGGPGGAPVWIGAGLVLAGWAALFRPERRLVVGTAWAVAGVAVAAGVVVSRLPVTGPTLQTPVSGWPGYPTVLIGGALIVAAVVAGEGAREWLSKSRFGWRQPFVALATVAAMLVPVVGTVWWVARGADDPLERRDPRVLPAYISDEAEQLERVRTLVLNRADDGRVTYALLRASGPRMGDAETGPPPEMYGPLDEVVSDIVSGRGGADGARLAEFAAKYVYLTAPYDRELADTLDTVPGLVRASAPEGAAMWRVDQPVGRIWIAQPEPGEGEAAVVPEDDEVVVASDEIDARGTIPAGADGRLLVLSELADEGWSATLDGSPLEPTLYDGWAQAFALGPEGGDLELTHQGTRRAGVLLVQLGTVVLAIVLALPGMRRERGAVEHASELDPEDPTSPNLPTVPAEPGPGPRQVPAYSQPAVTVPGTPQYPYEPAELPTRSVPVAETAPQYAQPPLSEPVAARPKEPSIEPPQGQNTAPAAVEPAPEQPGEGTGRRYRGRRAARRDDEDELSTSTDGGTYRGRRAAGRRSGKGGGRRAKGGGDEEGTS
ncbi:glycosyltransferase family 2 protein [Phytoactinopolyspora mesophila]|uniref:Glycosyltransferase n=1 Tax=Phytoactinopolyspora mesophila TaxID=2650750 RepID=A0A7K3M286_9ACTN|nr:glycosyltransferase family 2 protein [Phytoactinopolyspora mesophila]NDL57404.1 glycosyltransferase [Phytoactinopolyspora mesophila]